MRVPKVSGVAALAGVVTALALIAPAAGAATAGRPSRPHRSRDVAHEVSYGQLAANAVAEKVESAVAAKHLSGFSGLAVFLRRHILA